MLYRLIAFSCIVVLSACQTVPLKGYEGKPIVHVAPQSCPPVMSGYGSWKSISGNQRSTVHTGLDIVEEKGFPLIATAPGIVISATKLTNTGYSIYLGHGFDKFGNYVVSFYGHNEENLVVNGEEVKRGQKIGTIGKTGIYGGKFFHLHFEGMTHVSGKNFDLRYNGSLRDRGVFNPHHFFLTSSEGKFVPFDPNRDYGDKEGIFTGFTYPVPCE